jgi:hypothetical protein
MEVIQKTSHYMIQKIEGRTGEYIRATYTRPPLARQMTRGWKKTPGSNPNH